MKQIMKVQSYYKMLCEKKHLIHRTSGRSISLLLHFKTDIHRYTQMYIGISDFLVSDFVCSIVIQVHSCGPDRECCMVWWRDPEHDFYLKSINCPGGPRNPSGALTSGIKRTFPIFTQIMITVISKDNYLHGSFHKTMRKGLKNLWKQAKMVRLLQQMHFLVSVAFDLVLCRWYIIFKHNRALTL